MFTFIPVEDFVAACAAVTKPSCPALGFIRGLESPISVATTTTLISASLTLTMSVSILEPSSSSCALNSAFRARNSS